MGSKKVNFVCQQCGYVSPRWIGKCPDCDSWGSFVEEVVKEAGIKNSGGLSVSSKPVGLCEIVVNQETRMLTCVSEVDRVLGGGIVPGSLVLVGGDPGIGKSTLLLQIGHNVAQKYGRVLYISGEESLAQIKLRAARLKIDAPDLFVLTETNLETVSSHIKEINPLLVFIDSIQTMYTADFPSAPGSVGQVRECAVSLMALAKQLNIPVFLAGHVTKDGSIAGPRVLEHLVDTVLYFESYKHQQYRILRSVKNRFGSTNEIGVFAMTGNGLEEVFNPSQLFLSERPLGVSGTSVVCSLEGTRPLLLEIQALVSSTPFGNPRRLCTGVDLNRALLMIAVLDKKVGLHLSGEDIYLNIAGGIKSSEPSLDLGICLALASAFKNKAIDPHTLIIGEVGLTGEVRGVADCQKRITEGEKLGFKRCILPRRSLDSLSNVKEVKIELVGIKKVEEAIHCLLNL